DTEPDDTAESLDADGAETTAQARKLRCAKAAPSGTRLRDARARRDGRADARTPPPPAPAGPRRPPPRPPPAGSRRGRDAASRSRSAASRRARACAAPAG